MEQTRTVHVLVHGRVQGVGFRAWVQHHAELHRLKGWVRNRRDGAVEAVFSGTQQGGGGGARRLPPGSGRRTRGHGGDGGGGRLDGCPPSVGPLRAAVAPYRAISTPAGGCLKRPWGGFFSMVSTGPPASFQAPNPPPRCATGLNPISLSGCRGQRGAPAARAEEDEALVFGEDRLVVGALGGRSRIRAFREGSGSSPASGPPARVPGGRGYRRTPRRPARGVPWPPRVPGFRSSRSLPRGGSYNRG